MHDTDPVLRTVRLTLRPLRVDDITPAYVAWLNEPAVTRYLEIRFTPKPLAVVERYVAARYADRSAGTHFGVFDREGTRHVGTVTLNSLNNHHKTADISFVIGHGDVQGKGYATEAVHAVCIHAFGPMGLHKLTGGHYASNLGSLRVFEKNGFCREGCRAEQVCNADGEREDIVLHGLLGCNFQRNPR